MLTSVIYRDYLRSLPAKAFLWSWSLTHSATLTSKLTCKLQIPAHKMGLPSTPTSSHYLKPSKASLHDAKLKALEKGCHLQKVMLLEHTQSTLQCPTGCKLSATCKDNPFALGHCFSQSHRAPRSSLQHLLWQQQPPPVSDHTPSRAQYETWQRITCAGVLMP